MKKFERSFFIKISVFCLFFVLAEPVFSMRFGGSLGYGFSGTLAKDKEGKNSVTTNSLDLRSTFAWNYVDLSFGLRLDVEKSHIIFFSDIEKGTKVPNPTTTPTSQIKGKFETYDDVYTIQYFTFELLGKVPAIVGLTANTSLYPLFGVAIDLPIFGIVPPDFLIALQGEEKIDPKENYGEYYLMLLKNHLAIWGKLGIGLDIFTNDKVCLRPQLLCGITHAIVPNKRDLGIRYKIDLRLGFSYKK